MYHPDPRIVPCLALCQKSAKVPAFVRFSTVAESKGSKDTTRDVRGFAVVLYTEEGNWDLGGNNIPVFFIQDAMKLPDLVHAVKPEADRGFPQAASILAADEMIGGAPSVLFDAVALGMSKTGADALALDKAALDFVSDAFAHCKAIGHTPEALFAKAGIEPDEWFFGLPQGADKLIQKLPERNWVREKKGM